MNYTELIEYMHKYRAGKMSREEMACAIHMWQRANMPIGEDGNVKRK